MFVRSLATGPLLLIVFFHGSICVDGLRCYGCDVASELGYDEAEKACNMQGARDCPDPKYRACMTEAFTRDSSYQVLKRCINECPVFLNSTAEHIRCCVQDACNDVMALDPMDRTHPQPGHMGDINTRPAVPPGPGSQPGGGMSALAPAGGGQGGPGQKAERMTPPSGTPPTAAGGVPGRAQKPHGRPDNEMNVRKSLIKSGGGSDYSSGVESTTIRSTCHTLLTVPLVLVLISLGC